MKPFDNKGETTITAQDYDLGLLYVCPLLSCWVAVFHIDRFHSQITYQSWKWGKFVFRTIRSYARLDRYHNDWSLFNWTHESLGFAYFFSFAALCVFGLIHVRRNAVAVWMNAARVLIFFLIVSLSSFPSVCRYSYK